MTFLQSYMNLVSKIPQISPEVRDLSSNKITLGFSVFLLCYVIVFRFDGFSPLYMYMYSK